MRHPEFWWKLKFGMALFFEIFSLRFFRHYSNPDFVPYQPTNAWLTNVRPTNVRLLRSRAWVRTLYLFYKCSTYKCSTSPKSCVGSDLVSFLQMFDLQMFDFSEVVRGFGPCIFSTNVRPLARSSGCPMIYWFKTIALKRYLESQGQDTDLLGGQIFVA